MAELVWQPNRAAMRGFLSGGQGPAFKAVRRVQQETAAFADSKVPTDTGALKGSQVKTPIAVTGDRVVGGVEYRSPYAQFVHDGTKPHVIKARNSRVLVKVNRGASGATFFGPIVNHPGTKAQPWLRVSAWAAAKRNGFDFRQG